MIEVGPNKSLHYDVDVDYDVNTYNCECPDYCRCGVIENAKVQKICPSHAERWVSSFVKGNDLEQLLAFMFFRHCLEPDNFYVSICQGYYGEEIVDVKMERGGYDKIAHFNTLMASNDIRSILAMILTHHYGYVRPDVLDHKDWKLIEVSPKDIEVPKAGAQQVSNVGYDYWDERRYPVWYPGCVVIPDGDKLKIIDGFHRWTNFNSKKKRRKVKVLAPKR